jgi:hypothetical protein
MPATANLRRTADRGNREQFGGAERDPVEQSGKTARLLQLGGPWAR